MKTFVIVWIAVCSTISVLIAIAAILNAIFAIRMRGRVLGDGSFGGGHDGTMKHGAVNSHFGGAFDGGASLECGGNMTGVGDFGGSCPIGGVDGGFTGCGDGGGGGGSMACSSGDGGGGCGC